MNSSGWSQTLCKVEKIETTIGDNEPEVSVNEIQERVRGNPGFTPVDTGDNEPEVSVNEIQESVRGTQGFTPVDTGDNVPEVSVNEIQERLRGTPGFIPVDTGDNQLVVHSVELLDTGVRTDIWDDNSKRI